jgi:hypothetical protein
MSSLIHMITNIEALTVTQKSKNNKQLLNVGEYIAWIADGQNTGDKYVARFYSSVQKPILKKHVFSSPKSIRKHGTILFKNCEI